MRLSFMVMAGSILLFGLGLSNSRAADQPDLTSSRSLCAYLHEHRLPLVEARVMEDPDGGGRALLLYGFVATPRGKQDAENQARDFLGDPDIEVANRIKVTPELLGLKESPNGSHEGAAASNDSAAADASAADQTSGEKASLTDESADDSPQAMADREAYANQALTDEMLQTNGSIPAFSMLIILGSAPSVHPPIIHYPYFFPPLHPVPYPQLSAIHPPVYPPPFHVSPYPAGSIARPNVFGYATPFSPIQATPPFPSAPSQFGGGFAPPGGGFGRPGFSPGFGGGGFGGGGFGGHR